MKRPGSGQQLYGVFISCGIKIEGEKTGKNCWSFAVNLHCAAPGRGWGQGDKGTREQGDKGLCRSCFCAPLQPGLLLWGFSHENEMGK